MGPASLISLEIMGDQYEYIQSKLSLMISFGILVKRPLSWQQSDWTSS